MHAPEIFVPFVRQPGGGKFPDRSVGEAISRLAGVSLERGEYGEGTTIKVGGNMASQTGVGIDGLGVRPAMPTFGHARRFPNAKVSCRFGKGIEAFVDGRAVHGRHHLPAPAP